MSRIRTIVLGCLAVAANASASNLMYVSWGDRVMLSEGPHRLDTPGRIETAFARWQANYGVDTIIWRISDEVIRSECECRITGPFYRAYYDKVAQVNAQYGDPIRLARETARRQGLKFFIYETFLDCGCPTNVLYGDTVPFPWQYRETQAHPEWEEVDLRGNRHYGVLDLSVPAARRFAVDKFVRYAAKFNPDGVYVCDRSHSHPAEHADQFGFGPVIVSEYARHYGIDITKDPRFDWRSLRFAPQSPEVRAWRQMRGEFLMRFYRELRAALPDRLVYLALPRGEYLGAPYGNLPVDTARVVREKLADGIVLNVYSGRFLYPKDTRPHAARGYLASCDDSYKVPDKVSAIASLGALCRANGVRLFYSGTVLEEPSCDGMMLVEAFPRAANLRVWDTQSVLAGERFSLTGWFKLDGPFPQDAQAPRLVNKYAHDLAEERGWELYVNKGRLVFRLQLVLPGGARKDFSFASDSDFPLGRWVKVSAAFDGAKGKASVSFGDVPAGRASLPTGSRLAANPQIPVMFGAYAHGGQYANLQVGPVTLRGKGADDTVCFDFTDPAHPVSGAAAGLRVRVDGKLPTVSAPVGFQAFDLTFR